ncbi:MAG: EamA family transporter [Caldilineaceae bacterium]
MISVAVSYILVSVVVGAAGQLLLKYGMSTMGAITLIPQELPAILWRLATNPIIVGGLGLYATGTVFWLAALSRVDLSYAYPFASLSYLVMLLASWVLFSEHITPLRLMGTLIIGLGVLLISRS